MCKAARLRFMIQTVDIREKIKSDFDDKALDVIAIFDEAISKADYLNNIRVIRCIIFLSDKNINKLKENIRVATCDPRDVILWAEYKNRGQGEQIKRIRDFNKPFDEAHKVFKE